MTPHITTIPAKKLAGKHLRMSIENNRTVELWKSFMPERKHIKNTLSPDLFELLIYDQDLDFKDFNHTTEFEKWTAVEVSEFTDIPEGMEAHTLTGGLYAVFTHKGTANMFATTYLYIFTQWLPESEYMLDKREHFQLLGEKYKRNADDSEEEIWVPVRRKG